MPIVHDKPPRYRSYVLRCWEMRSQDPERPATWRFSLEEAQTREKRTFADPGALATFLQTELGEGRMSKCANTVPVRREQMSE